ncbi:uncharacterized protein LOC118486347 isoform X2 [Helianthus annuus]|uniref:uncharacterized protein LOC118486347 isoform X2 n=1 Tax=Helianthus annuus TaxID=4232 RepID=UPI0016533D76|nr:uncharacterized protein LOC118486347 isoform X2 [Helianthus annuus]
MDNKNNAPSLLKSIEDYDPIFFELFVDQKQEIPYDFATLLWGEQLPYVNVLKLLMMIYRVYFGWSGVFGCNYVGQRYACYCCKLVPCRLVLLDDQCISLFEEFSKDPEPIVS